MTHKLKVKVNDKWYTVEVPEIEGNPVRVLVDGDAIDVDIDCLEPLSIQSAEPNVELDSPPEVKALTSGKASESRTFYSPMPGLIVSVSVKEGDQVVTGDEICVLEAMKMQQALRADWSGIIKKLYVETAQHVREGDPIAELA